LLQKSLANYSSVNGDNIDEIIKPIPVNLLGFLMTACTTKKGNLLADNPETMEKLFANQIHYCHSFRKEEIVEANEQAFREQYGEDVPVSIIQLLEVPKAVTKLQTCD
jgi:dihydroorotase